ncbi:hypothetical protein FKM95_000045 [Candidatus Tremblaya phenacola]|nr:hypothetical protein FKM95_000045 [Candidatus Tremblaya phenacola]
MSKASTKAKERLVHAYGSNFGGSKCSLRKRRNTQMQTRRGLS